MVSPVSPERGRQAWEGAEDVGQELRKQKYDDYIADASQQAAAIGRREPYHLTYLKRYGTGPETRQLGSPGKTGRRARNGEDGSREEQYLQQDRAEGDKM